MQHVFCSEVKEEFTDYGFIAPNGIKYNFVIEVQEDMIRIADSIGHQVPVDITNIDQLIHALLKARDLMLVPAFQDTYVDMGT